MNEVIKFLKNNNTRIKDQMIHVYGWQKEYDVMIRPSICQYLFEELVITENIIPLTNDNRDGRIKPKYYITVHDTGDAACNHNARFWSETVKNECWEEGPYGASFQYVVGNDGIFHQIPDNEVAYHAGDSTKYDYALYETGVEGTITHPTVTISDDGYYMIDNKKTIIMAPRAYKEKDGKVIFDRIPTTKDINSQGVLCKLINGKYYIGETYFNQTYELIANRGGNNNSIGIESCINEGTDLYLTWQKTAKLVAYLLKNNNLTFDDIKQHHYFSGKNCPQTMRMNNLWDYFIKLVKVEYQMLLYKEEGYKFELFCDNPNVLPNGRVINEIKSGIKYQIKVTKGKETEMIELEY